MTDIRRVLFFEDVPLFVDLVFFQDLVADLFSKCSTVFILKFFYRFITVEASLFEAFEFLF